ncbi:MAG: TVP38/TMEM64 family protein [Gemmatales bacterium]|nr:MAG: TVP38/TMEM64 family protein [Gemmatales bacterium]
MVARNTLCAPLYSSVGSSVSKRTVKTAVFVSVILSAVAAYLLFRDHLTLEHLARHEARLRAWQNEHPWLVFLLAYLVYTAVTALSLPIAAPLSLVYGWYFGLIPAFVVVSFGSTSGATLAFLLSRYLFRDFVERKFGEQLASFNDTLKREGAFYLFTLRLIPAVPFFVINVVMGLTPIRLWTFWWVSQIGMIPGTIVYVFAGSSVPDLQTLASQGASGILTRELLIAFAILGIFPLAVRKLVSYFRPADHSHARGDADAYPAKPAP